MPTKTESKTDRLNNELEQIKFMFNSSQKYLQNYFDKLKNDHLSALGAESSFKEDEITKKLDTYRIECLKKNEFNNEEFKNEIQKMIEIIELKIKNYKETDCNTNNQDSDDECDDNDEDTDNDDSDDDDEDDSDEDEDDADDEDDEEEDLKYKEIKNLLQIENIKIKKKFLSNRSFISLNKLNCKDPFLLNGYESKLIICLDECFCEQSILSLKKK
jgi:phosphopantothenoylcysteine synthetase/decarboxylase